MKNEKNKNPKKNKFIVLFGKKGSGKTEFAKRKLIPRFPRVVILDVLDEYDDYYTVDSVQRLIEFLKANSKRDFFKVSYKPFDEMDERFYEICYNLYNVTIVAEEVDLHCNVNKCDDFLLKILKYGRHRNLNLIAISRRPAEVNKMITAQADVILTFQQSQKLDIDFFSHYIDNPETLMKLKVGEYKKIQGRTYFS